MNKRNPFQCDFSPVSPYDSLGISAKKFVWELSQELGTSTQLVACILLSMFASAQVGVSCEVQDNFIVRLSFYLAYGAPPSTGKSPALNRMISSLHKLISRYILLSKDEAEKRKSLIRGLELKTKNIEKKISKSNDYIQQSKYAEDVSLAKSQIEKLKIPVTPIMGKMSIQSFVKELSLRGGRGIQVDSEGGILASLNTVSTTEITPILQAWSNEPISNVTKHEQDYIDVSSFVNLTLWQCDPVCKIVRDSKYQSIGFPARILICLERDLQPKFGNGKVSSESEDWYSKQLEAAFCRFWLNLSGDTKEFVYRLSPNAHFIHKEFKVHTIEQLNGNEYASKHGDIVGKLDIHALHLAMIIQSMEFNDSYSSEIEEDLMHRACCLSKYFAVSHIDILNGTEYEEMLELAKPLIAAISMWQEVCHSNDLIALEEFRISVGFSKLKFEKIISWFERNEWIKLGIKKKNIILGEVNDLLQWELLVRFKDFL